MPIHVLGTASALQFLIGIFCLKATLSYFPKIVVLSGTNWVWTEEAVRLPFSEVV